MYGEDLDRALLYQARKFITGANVHHVKTWIFCYQISAPHSEFRRQYERLSANLSLRKIDGLPHRRTRNLSVVVRVLRMPQENHWFRKSKVSGSQCRTLRHHGG
jgi:hypothetical protein